MLTTFWPGIDFPVCYFYFDATIPQDDTRILSCPLTFQCAEDFVDWRTIPVCLQGVDRLIMVVSFLLPCLIVFLPLSSNFFLDQTKCFTNWRWPLGIHTSSVLWSYQFILETSQYNDRIAVHFWFSASFCHLNYCFCAVILNSHA